MRSYSIRVAVIQRDWRPENKEKQDTDPGRRRCDGRYSGWHAEATSQETPGIAKKRQGLPATPAAERTAWSSPSLELQQEHVALLTP